MIKKTNDKTKKIIFGIFFSILVIVFISLLIFTSSSKTIKEIKQFVKTDDKVLYISDGTKNSDEIIKLMNKYDVYYLEIDSSKLNLFERKKIEKLTNTKYLNDVAVIFKNGKVKDALIEYEFEEQVVKFFQKNKLIPKIIVDDVKNIMKEVKNILNSEYSMVYIPYENYDLIEEQDKIFKEIASEYSIDYKKIDAYLLGYNQKETINQILKLSFVDDQILIIIKDNKMIGNIRGMHSKNTYIETLSDLNFIKEIENKINEIDYHTFKEKLTNNDKSIIIIGNNDLKDCETISNVLNDMIYSYNISVDYINVGNVDSTLYKKVQEKIENIGYKEGFSLPMVIIVESNTILSHVIGSTNEEYFLDIFIENGVIKGESINE